MGKGKEKEIGKEKKKKKEKKRKKKTTTSPVMYSNWTVQDFHLAANSYLIHQELPSCATQRYITIFTTNITEIYTELDSFRVPTHTFVR
jgi:hypothetical protein